MRVRLMLLVNLLLVIILNICVFLLALYELLCIITNIDKRNGANQMKTFTKKEATQIAEQFGLYVPSFRGNAKVTIEQDFLPDGRQILRFRAAGGKYKGAAVGSAYPA